MKNLELYKKASDMGFNKIYPFATENISGYIDGFNLKRKSLLTIGSSGDQVINAILKGCRDINVIDINPYTEYYYYLKLACLLELDYYNFTSFLHMDHSYLAKQQNTIYEKETFNRIKGTLKVLNEEAFEFWNEIFESKGKREIRDLFSTDIYDLETNRKINPYLSSPIAYEDAKKKAPKVDVHFEVKNIFDAEYERKFDNIWLSNICKYLSPDKTIEMIKLMISFLEKNGKMLMCYSYKVHDDDSKRDLYDIGKALEHFKNYILYSMTFETTKVNTFSNTNSDSILIYKNKQ